MLRLFGHYLKSIDRCSYPWRVRSSRQAVSYGALINVAVIVALFCTFSRIWHSVPTKFRT
jgi:hypothetical protein